jgi:hypothetical protein
MRRERLAVMSDLTDREYAAKEETCDIFDTAYRRAMRENAASTPEMELDIRALEYVVKAILRSFNKNQRADILEIVGK